MAGRKTKLTPERQQKIVELLQAGNYASIACQSARISEETYYSWKERGKRDKDNYKTTLYSEFLEAVETAEARAEADMVLLIKNSAINGNLQAAVFYLERKHPDRWGRNDKLRQEVSGSFGVIDTTQARKDVLDYLKSRGVEEDDGKEVSPN